MTKYFAWIAFLLWTMALAIIFESAPNIALCMSQNNYIVGPGDVLDIQIWDNSDLNRIVEISQDGSFSFPFIGKIITSNLSIFQIERLLINKLSDGYLVAPQVSISVAEYQNQKVFLFGEIARPGSYILKHHSQLLEIISEAGGFTEQRGTTGIVIRPETGAKKKRPTPLYEAKKSEIIQINLDKLISGAEDTSPFYVMPGDSIYISESEKIFVTGEVWRPGELRWEKGLTVRQAVSMAGGSTPKASIKRIQIIRYDNSLEKTIKPKLGDPVLPNDIIKVPESYF